jgi:hypothetical protein
MGDLRDLMPFGNSLLTIIFKRGNFLRISVCEKMTAENKCEQKVPIHLEVSFSKSCTAFTRKM